MDQLRMDAKAEFQSAIGHSLDAGYRVDGGASMPGQVALVKGHRPNHLLHLLLSLVTLGLWLPVWLIIALTTKETRLVLSVTPDGRVVQRPGPPGPSWATASLVTEATP